MAELTFDEVAIELAALTATGRRLFASEERRRQLLVSEMATREDERVAVVAATEVARAAIELDELRAQWAALLDETLEESS